MPQITDSDWATNYKATITVFGVNTVQKFIVGETIYLKRDLIVSAAASEKEFQWKTYTVMGHMQKDADFGGANKLEDVTGVSAVTNDAPVDPDPTSVGNLTTPHFYYLFDPSLGRTVPFVHQSEVLPKTQAKTYFSNQVANL